MTSPWPSPSRPACRVSLREGRINCSGKSRGPEMRDPNAGTLHLPPSGHVTWAGPRLSELGFLLPQEGASWLLGVPARMH